MDDNSTVSPAEGVPGTSDSQLTANAEICNTGACFNGDGSCGAEQEQAPFEGAANDRVMAERQPSTHRDDVGEGVRQVAAYREATPADLLCETHGEQGPVQTAPALPEVLERRSLARWKQQFLSAYRPVGPTETALMYELARHAAAAEFWDQGSAAVGRRTARLLREWAEESTLERDADADVALAGVATADSLDRCDRHGCAHGRAFLCTLEKLESLQTARRDREEVVGEVLPPLGFADEEACERYLAARFAAGEVPCANCSGKVGVLIKTRKCWECRRCKRQCGYRAGTVIARSPLPLRQWFDAVRLVLWRPQVDALVLAEFIGIERLTTVREMVHRIRAALERPQPGPELVGLDRHFAAKISPASSARQDSRAREISGGRRTGVEA